MSLRECQRKIVVIVWIRFKFNALLRFINTLIYSVRCIEHIILFDIELKYWASVYSIYRIDDLIDLSVYGWVGSIWTDGMSIEYTLILNINNIAVVLDFPKFSVKIFRNFRSLIFPKFLINFNRNFRTNLTESFSKKWLSHVHSVYTKWFH